MRFSQPLSTRGQGALAHRHDVNIHVLRQAQQSVGHRRPQEFMQPPVACVSDHQITGILFARVAPERLVLGNIRSFNAQHTGPEILGEAQVVFEPAELFG